MQCHRISPNHSDPCQIFATSLAAVLVVRNRANLTTVFVLPRVSSYFTSPLTTQTAKYQSWYRVRPARSSIASDSGSGVGTSLVGPAVQSHRRLDTQICLHRLLPMLLASCAAAQGMQSKLLLLSSERFPLAVPFGCCVDSRLALQKQRRPQRFPGVTRPGMSALTWTPGKHPASIVPRYLYLGRRGYSRRR